MVALLRMTTLPSRRKSGAEKSPGCVPLPPLSGILLRNHGIIAGSAAMVRLLCPWPGRNLRTGNRGNNHLTRTTNPRIHLRPAALSGQLGTPGRHHRRHWQDDRHGIESWRCSRAHGRDFPHSERFARVVPLATGSSRPRPRLWLKSGTISHHSGIRRAISGQLWPISPSARIAESISEMMAKVHPVWPWGGWTWPLGTSHARGMPGARTRLIA